MWAIKVVLLFAVISVSHGSVLLTDEVTRVEAERNNFYISYFLYNRNHSQGSYFDNVTPPTASDIDPSAITVIIVHGHVGWYLDPFSSNVRAAFGINTESNVFVMDWSYIAGQSYSKAVEDLLFAAIDLAAFIIELRHLIELPSNQDIHLIGFGLGAHLVGNAGHQLRATTPIPRITGLDPVAKHFGPNSRRLTYFDANYVEVIHTDGSSTGVGIGIDLGHVDFFVNGGSVQPGCETSVCNHNRAWELFASTLQYSHLVGYRCTSFEQLVQNSCIGIPLRMGGPELSKIPLLPGIYRANTGSSFPFRR